MVLTVGRGRVWHMRCGRHWRRNSGIGGGRIWMSSLSLRGSHGIPQTAAVGRPARVRSGAGGTAGIGEVYRRREDDAARASVLPAVVDGTVRIGARRRGSHSGRDGDVRRARSVAASTILTVVVIAAAGVLNVATAAGVLAVVVTGASRLNVVVRTAGVLAVAVPAAAAVTGRVLLEPFVDFSRFARIAFPFENHADAQYESESADDPDDAEGHADAGFVCEKAFGGGARCWSADTVDVEPAVFRRKFGPVLVPPRPVILPGW